MIAKLAIQLRQKAMRSLLLILCCLLAPVSAMTALAQSDNPSYYALVIGNHEYKRASDTPNARNDARDIANRLDDLGYELIGDRALLNQTRAQIIRRVRELARTAKPGDIAFFYYAGHGAHFGEGNAADNYLFPVNDEEVTHREDLLASAVPLSSLTKALSDAQVLGAVVIDACRDLPLPSRRTGRSTGQRGLTAPQSNTASGLFVAFAADVGQTAEDGTGTRNSPFASALLSALRNPQRRVEDIFIEVKNTVEQRTGGLQSPMTHSHLRTSRFYIRPALIQPAKPANLDKVRDDSVWQFTERQNTRAAYEAYLAEFPQGAHRAKASAKLAALPMPQAARPASRYSSRLLSMLNTHDDDKVLDAFLREANVTEYERRAEAGDAVAATITGLAYYWGQSVTQNNAQARLFLKQGCDAGEKAGCTHLGVMYRYGHGVTKDEARARALYQQGCDGGNARGCSNLGVLYQGGLGGAKDERRARTLYKQGCDGGNARGCSGLGYLYEKGLGGAKDEARARTLYQQGCDGGSATGCSNLGRLYQLSLGGAKDETRARALYQQGCDGGNANGCSNLGNLYRLGLGGGKDLVKARTFLKQGCDGGNDWGCERLKELSDKLVTKPDSTLVEVCPEQYRQEIVYYEYAKARSAETRKAVNRVLDVSPYCRIKSVRVVGHTETSGSATYNLAFSKRRAQDVREELIRQGVNPDIITSEGKGETEPFVQTGDGIREILNRRTEILVELEQVNDD